MIMGVDVIRTLITANLIVLLFVQILVGAYFMGKVLGGSK